MNNTDVFLKEAVERSERLNKQALTANEHLKAIYDIRRLYREHRQVFNLAPLFFALSYNAHISFIHLSITKMFCSEESGDESSIILLHDIVKKKRNGKPFDVIEYESTFSEQNTILQFGSIDEAYEIIKEEIAKKKEAINRIKARRNKYYAHMDLAKSKDYEKFFEDTEVKLSEIDELLNLNFTICNCINMVLREKTLSHEVIAPGSLDLLASCAEKGIAENHFL